MALKEVYSPASSFFNAGDIKIEEGDVEYLTSHELIDTDVQAAVLLSDPQDEPLLSERKKASSREDQIADDLTKEPATGETLNAADGTERSLETPVPDQDSVQPEDNRGESSSGCMLPSLLQMWIQQVQ